MLIEIHMLKNFAPTNLNRDDTGAPKTCLFGNYQRGRISSQCLKRSWRKSELFIQGLGSDKLGIRTRYLPELVTEKLRAQGVTEDLLQLAEKKLSGFGNKDGTENTKGSYTAQMIFYAPEDIDAVAALVLQKIAECSNDKSQFKAIKAKDLQAAVKDARIRPITPDIALFGRMVTSDAFADVDAAMQVAHAISTNRLTMESDFFTAMDDKISGESLDDLGAGMMGDIDFNSSCYYIYACLDTQKLHDNLANVPDQDALLSRIIPILLETMAYSNPSGKQNTFAGHALPSAVLVECKDKLIPTSYVNAFVKPIDTQKGDLIESSIRALSEEVNVMDLDYGLPLDKRLWFCSHKYDVSVNNAVRCDSFAALVAALTDYFAQK